jgi:hypothetical protein
MFSLLILLEPALYAGSDGAPSDRNDPNRISDRKCVFASSANIDHPAIVPLHGLLPGWSSAQVHPGLVNSPACKPVCMNNLYMSRSERSNRINTTFYKGDVSHGCK